MKSTVEYVNLLRRYFEEVARQEGVTKMALFGSVARGEQNEDSDVDVAYEGSPNPFLRIRMKMDLEQLFGCKVDVIRLRKQFSGTVFGDNLNKDLIYV